MMMALSAGKVSASRNDCAPLAGKGPAIAFAAEPTWSTAGRDLLQRARHSEDEPHRHLNSVGIGSRHPAAPGAHAPQTSRTPACLPIAPAPPPMAATWPAPAACGARPA